MEWEWINLVRSRLFGLFLPPRMMSVGHLVEWVAGETELLGENLSKCRFVHHKSAITWLASNSNPRSGKPETNLLSYSKVYKLDSNLI
jgi:hypothetical protein